uniref:Calcitonin peptide-like domain-containing protein n=1 Tax=Eptatretus burgeri TaxID=7764 RepID=A0A8C4R3Q9_EPTBU
MLKSFARLFLLAFRRGHCVRRCQSVPNEPDGHGTLFIPYSPGKLICYGHAVLQDRRCSGLSTCVLAELGSRLYRLSALGRTHVGAKSPGRRRHSLRYHSWFVGFAQFEISFMVCGICAV